METKDPEELAKAHSHTMLYVASGLSLVAVVLLIVVLAGMIFKKNTPPATATMPSETTDQTAPGSSFDQVSQQLQKPAAPTHITTMQDLNNALKTLNNTLNSTDTTTVTTGLDQNTQDASSFSQ